MEFMEKLQGLSEKIEQVAGNLATEEATKNALVMPFLHTVLGYDIFDPNEVVPEFTADTATKKNEKVDYALVKDDEVQILIECKKFGENLTQKHTGQLYRYFSVTKARLAILTNGSKYQFFTDLDAANVMDDKPFLTLDLEDIDEYVVPEVKKLTKSAFDVESIVDAAGDLKYLNQIKKELRKQFESPEEEFVRFFASRVYDGMLTPKVKSQFLEMTTKALKQFLNESINDRLKSAIGPDVQIKNEKPVVVENDTPPEPEKVSKIVTTEEEIEGFNIVKAIVRQRVPAEKVAHRDTQSYFGILFEDNNRKPICRLHFNGKQKYIGLFDEEKKETRHPIDTLDDIFKFDSELLETVGIYVEPEEIGL
ncbi:type I restriction endonuclease [Desulfoluna butyratoxydans]|uniref:Type i restriction enzyme r protein n-terminal domain n=1 Tax=Desulfoluna butyratoxydans TaxID=231438 RepID=A0A4U8YYS8_9BACT|nr:type I restriction enzyme HsdR N-terminal domain-containing protein [Desulfoluna butyratoxydans]VFQ47382.1 type i restriction enzyme r protein n-terminal domain [Desulfoluna butyratoxydans]